MIIFQDIIKYSDSRQGNTKSRQIRITN